MGRRTTGSCRRCIRHNRSAQHQQMYHGGGQATSSQLGSSLLRLQIGIQQSPPWLHDKGARMDRNTEECDQAYQGVVEEMENDWRSGVMVNRWQFDEYRYCVVSSKVISPPQLDFVSVKYWYVVYSKIAVDTEWESQAIVSWKWHIACLTTTLRCTKKATMR